MSDDAVIKKARKSSLQGQSDAAKTLGISLSSYLPREREPEIISIGELKKLYESFGLDGKCFIREWLDSIFLPVNV